ncbi:MAG: GWxTD domain-containing protein [Acidobacteriota bacterium]
MIIKKISLYFLASLFFITSLSINLSSKDSKIKNLPEKYRKWLEEEVVYIIKDKEREVFLQLQTDKERDLFIEAFWAIRDPTPGTPVNEFKDEHYRRIEYANKFLGRDSPRPGWMTDRGRIYIILGEPRDKETYDSSQEVYPTEIWFYQGDVSMGLPPYFNVVFFKRDGVGEYILYSPLKDGPQSLMIGGQVSYKNLDEIIERLKEIPGQLAQVSLSLIPGDSTSDPNRLSAASEVLLGKIHEYPKRKVEDEYAEKLFRYRESIEVDYSVNYIHSESFIKSFRMNNNHYIVNLAIQPKRLSMDFYQNKYYTTLKVFGKITDLNDKLVFQFERSISIEIGEDRINELKSKPFCIVESFPVVSGNYKLNYLVKNIISKEFFSAERNISLPEIKDLFITPITLGYELKEIPLQPVKPFKIGDRQILCDTNQTFTPKDNLIIFFQIFNTEKYPDGYQIKYSFFKEEKEIKVFQKRLAEYSDKNNIFETVSLNDFSPGEYKLRISLLNKENREVLFEEERFLISPIPFIPRPWMAYKTSFKSEDDPFLFYILGIQYLNMNKLKEAKETMEIALKEVPNSLQYSIGLAKIYLIENSFDKVIDLLSPFISPLSSSEGQKNYEFYEILGMAYRGISKFNEAIENFKIALSLKGTDIRLLNLIGECYYNLGNKEEALKAFEKSIEINPNQDNIKNLIKEIKGKGDKK